MNKVIIWGILGLMFLGGFIYSHELGHKSIYNSYGIDSKIEWGLIEVTTVAEKTCPTQECILANNINDSIMYHVGILGMIFILGIMFLLMEKDVKDENKEMEVKQNG